MKVKDSIKAPVIRFQDKLTSAGSWMILRLPKTASSKLPSRGLVMVEGKFNGAGFKTALEPDGKGSHWFKIDDSIPKVGGLKIGSKVTVEIRPVKEWPEPKIPADLKKALAESPQAYKTWKDITPMARWDWIRWIRSTKNADTRKRRIEVTFSKFRSGKRRPCCFNRTECTIPDVSNKGILIEN